MKFSIALCILVMCITYMANSVEGQCNNMDILVMVAKEDLRIMSKIHYRIAV
uniref:U7-Sparatoxin-Hju1a_1 n=1 Tax=Heteropoda jugulans TaxID=1358901 RepID=A0A4V2H991_9ARAC